MTGTSRQGKKILRGAAGLVAACLLAAANAMAAEAIDVRSLLREMIDFGNLAVRPVPFFKQAAATSYDRASHNGGEDWFANKDVGMYVRTETNAGRKEHVLADLTGPGAVSRFWSANPWNSNITRFYFDGEATPRIEAPLEELFKATVAPFGPDFSYLSGTGGNLYYPMPYAKSLKITVEEQDKPLRLYYEIGYRTYEPGAKVVTLDPKKAADWAETQARVGRALARPDAASAPAGSEWIHRRLDVPAGATVPLPEIAGEKAVYEWTARVAGTNENGAWTDPGRAHNACRSLVLKIAFDGEASVETPLGDFFGSGPGVNPYENLFFTVDQTGRMTSRLLMPFRKSMALALTNTGRTAYAVELGLRVGPRPFPGHGYHLRAQWGALTRDTWPYFDTTFLDVAGEGKVVGTVYQIANPVLIWWGEGDQKVSIDGEAFPSTFGTGTEDDYGYAYGYNGPFTRPFHAQTRVDGPGSGGHISLNRWYVLDALPFAKSVRFVQEMWHWMPCRPTWGYVIYWYAKPGTPGPAPVDTAALAPVDLGIRENMLEPQEGEALRFEAAGGAAEKQRLANCSGAEHLVWHDAKPGDKLAVHFVAPSAGKYSIELNLCQSPDYGRYRLSVNGLPAGDPVDGYSDKLYWLHPKLGVFDLKEGHNTLVVEALEPNPAAKPGNKFGLDYVFLIRQ